MKTTFLLAPLVVLMLLLTGAGRATAAEKNSCGCYKDGAGTCFCDKKAKCGCPGDCEPKGCDEKREQQMKKEIEAETKKAAEADRRHKSATVQVKAEGSAGKADRADAPVKSEPAGKKLSAAEVKQLGKLLDSYLRQHPDARMRNAEELRNELTLTR
jgi:hypothetical protein